MAKFQLHVNTDNAAFEDDPAPELVRILRAVADRIESGDEYQMFRTIHDSNGNDVGRFALKHESYV
jgi:hypothetical protein